MGGLAVEMAWLCYSIMAGHVAILAYFGGSLDSASRQYRFGIPVILLGAVASAWAWGGGHAAGLSRMS